MGLSIEQQKRLHLAASIHDIGKIHVPADILNKPGPLTSIEYQMIKSHPEMGYEILKNANLPLSIAKIILQTHERLDGSGYPQGLKGDSILMEAKILAVAEVVEAMSSHRPYRPAHSIEETLEEIERGGGKTFDAHVVNICVKLFKRKEFEWKTAIY